MTSLIALASPAVAQERQHQHEAAPWQWGVEATVFGGYNYQRRKFTDLDEFESQNWLMTTLSRSFGIASHLRLDAMLSFEPFTLRDIGSPQVFQTGETCQGGPLIDYQHPHDLIMNLGGEYSRSIGARVSWADGPWKIQISGADLTTPETNSPYDASRVTASIEYFKGDAYRSIAWLAAFGQNREVFGNFEAYLVEGTRRFASNAEFMRAEVVDKDILDAGVHPIGGSHTHRPSQVGALTIGYVRDVVSKAWAPESRTSTRTANRYSAM